MAGLIFGNIAGAIVSSIHTMIHYIVEAIKWIKQGILKLIHWTGRGIREAINYEKTIVRESIRFLSRNDDIAFGLAFAILFDVLGVNS